MSCDLTKYGVTILQFMFFALIIIYIKKVISIGHAYIESFYLLIKRKWVDRFKILNYSHVYRIVFEYIKAIL